MVTVHVDRENVNHDKLTGSNLQEAPLQANGIDDVLRILDGIIAALNAIVPATGASLP